MRRRTLVLTAMTTVLGVASAFGTFGIARRAGAMPPRDQPGLLVRTLSVDGTMRIYRVYQPASLSAAQSRVPLVIALHGGSVPRKGLTMLEQFTANGLAERGQFLVALPDSGAKSWGDGSLRPADPPYSYDEIGFISAMIDALVKEFNVDPARVYVAGVSNGGFMAGRLACQLSDKIAATAVVSATMGTVQMNACQPVRPMPILFIQGTNDPLVHIDGGEVANTGLIGSSLNEAAAFWAKLNRCPNNPQVQDLRPTVNDGTWVTRFTYTDCDGQASVIVYQINNGGHTWPGGRQYLPKLLIGKVSRNLDASATIWDFFASRSLRTKA